jgi:hypothetical protein
LVVVIISFFLSFFLSSCVVVETHFSGTGDESEMTFHHNFSKGDPRDLAGLEGQRLGDGVGQSSSKTAVLPSRLYLFQFMRYADYVISLSFVGGYFFFCSIL